MACTSRGYKTEQSLSRENPCWDQLDKMTGMKGKTHRPQNAILPTEVITPCAVAAPHTLLPSVSKHPQSSQPYFRHLNAFRSSAHPHTIPVNQGTERLLCTDGAFKQRGMLALPRTTLAGCETQSLNPVLPGPRPELQLLTRTKKIQKMQMSHLESFISKTPAVGMNGGSADSSKQILCHPISQVPEILLIWANKFPQALDILLALIPSSHKKLFHRQGSYLQLLNSHNILSEVAFLTLPSPILDELSLSLLYRFVTNLVKIP